MKYQINDMLIGINLGDGPISFPLAFASGAITIFKILGHNFGELPY